MRVVPKNYGGYACGQWSLPNGETFEGVMKYESGRPALFHIPRDFRDLRKVYDRLVRGASADDLLFRTVTVN